MNAMSAYGKIARLNLVIYCLLVLQKYFIICKFAKSNYGKRQLKYLRLLCIV